MKGEKFKIKFKLKSKLEFKELGRSLDSEYSPIFDNMKKWLLLLFLGLVSISQAQEIIITSTQLLDGKSKYRFKERYTEWFTSNIIRYQFDSNLDKYVSDQIRINKTKAIFLPDTTLIKKKIKINKHQIVLADSVAQAFILLVLGTTTNSDGSSIFNRVSHRYEHIYVYYINDKDTVTFHIFSPEYRGSSWENSKYRYHRTTSNFDRLIYMIMPEEFLLKNSIKKRL